ncbi:hypothetical protein GCM10009546_62180 [Actinomadura livida]|uniref:Uncharacterized protein n=1 Tax=Actinomadura livida TaxID=79909 RepID=A0ABN1FI75_9ACTN|nr:hypothetical protein GCM10010208_70260 [Actinomadura livida]
MRGAAGEPERPGDLPGAEPARTGGEQAQDRGGPLDRLHGSGHAPEASRGPDPPTMSAFAMITVPAPENCPDSAIWCTGGG